tara:strand:- start:3057 stop:3410 length:354 start_codon:yes stop_codon:yes gene_type:complete
MHRGLAIVACPESAKGQVPPLWLLRPMGYTNPPSLCIAVVMGLIKLIILGALIWLALNLWRRTQIVKNRAKGSSSPRDQAPVMVRCAHCQVHLPRDRALRANDNWYCCAEHRDAQPE